MNKNALVIGATGLLGYGITRELSKEGWNVRAIGKEPLVNSNIFDKNINYICGDFYNDAFLYDCLKNVDKVFFFLSSTFPSTSTDSLEFEISRTLKGVDYLLRKMREMNVEDIIFPSSGGTIYGNVENGLAKESDFLNTSTPYGVGKKMCEEIFKFYSEFGINATILRVGNVYGTPLVRGAIQGAIDIFVQRALNGESVTIWGDSLTNVRDYIFTDDFSEAVVKIADYKPDGVEIYNLSSGIGIQLSEIIQSINNYLGISMAIKYTKTNSTSEIKRIVLDMSKFCSKTGWQPRYTIDQGIAETIERKRKLNKMLF